MKKHLIQLLVFATFLAGLNTTAHASEGLAGAGSSAAAPVFKMWVHEYVKRGGDPIAYESVGSTAGMTRIRQRDVDFGASDVISPPAQLAKDGLIMFPTVISGVVPVVNLPKLGTPIKLDGDVLARIFMGEITQWNAAEIAKLNPQQNLPNWPIRVICRSDGSGSTYNFSDYLSKISPPWKKRFGAASKFDWPSAFIAVKGSSEISKTVQSTAGAIGYIDFNYVLDDGLVGVQLRNAAGHFVEPSARSFTSAVFKSRWFSHGDFAETLTNQAGEGSWPITMGTYVAIPKVATDAKRAARLLRFFTWALANGDLFTRQANLTPLPFEVQARAFKEISSVLGSEGELIGFQSLGLLTSPVLSR